MLYQGGHFAPRGGSERAARRSRSQQWCKVTRSTMSTRISPTPCQTRPSMAMVKVLNIRRQQAHVVLPVSDHCMDVTEYYDCFSGVIMQAIGSLPGATRVGRGTRWWTLPPAWATPRLWPPNAAL